MLQCLNQLSETVVFLPRMVVVVATRFWMQSWRFKPTRFKTRSSAKKSLALSATRGSLFQCKSIPEREEQSMVFDNCVRPFLFFSFLTEEHADFHITSAVGDPSAVFTVSRREGRGLDKLRGDADWTNTFRSSYFPASLQSLSPPLSTLRCLRSATAMPLFNF